MKKQLSISTIKYIIPLINCNLAVIILKTGEKITSEGAIEFDIENNVITYESFDKTF